MTGAGPRSGRRLPSREESSRQIANGSDPHELEIRRPYARDRLAYCIRAALSPSPLPTVRPSKSQVDHLPLNRRSEYSDKHGWIRKFLRLAVLARTVGSDRLAPLPPIQPTSPGTVSSPGALSHPV